MNARPLPRKASSALYDRAIRGVMAAEERRGTTQGIAVDSDPDALRWQAWNVAAMRLILAGAFGPICCGNRAQSPETAWLPRARFTRKASKPGRATIPDALATTPGQNRGTGSHRRQIGPQR